MSCISSLLEAHPAYMYQTFEPAVCLSGLIRTGLRLWISGGAAGNTAAKLLEF